MKNKQRLRFAIMFCAAPFCFTGCAANGVKGQGPADPGAVTESLTEAAETTETVTETEMETESGTASMHIENEKIDLAGLDTTPEGWGMGKECDALNRPEFCLIYQERYKDYPVYFIGPWEEGDPNIIYLTLNMGWSNKWVNLSLDTLQEKGVKAVFFSTGNVLWENPETIERVITEGHDLGNHSMHHKMDGMPSLSVEQQEAEIMDMHEMALNDFGYEMHLFRFPSGEFDEQSLAIVNNCNYKSVFWSYTYIDWDRSDQPDVEASVKDAVDHLHPGAIYCFHATSETSATMLGEFIDQVRANGYEFELLR